MAIMMATTAEHWVQRRSASRILRTPHNATLYSGIEKMMNINGAIAENSSGLTVSGI